MEIMTGKRYCDSDSPFIGQNGKGLTGKPWFFARSNKDETVEITAGESPVFVGGRQNVPYFDFTGQTKPGIIPPRETRRVTYKPGFDTWLVS